MKQCARCGKSRLFMKLNQKSLCNDCVVALEVEAAARKQKDMDDAMAFIKDFSSHVAIAVDSFVLFPGMGRKKLETIQYECDYIKNHIDDWLKYERFSDAFNATLQKDKYGHYISPLFPHMTIFKPESPEEYFERLNKSAQEIYLKARSALLDAYDYSEIFRIVGVTFKNGRKSRQTILRAIKFQDLPYGDDAKIMLQKELFEGNDAIGVYANGDKVGYISREDLPWILERWNEYVSVVDYDVHGGNGYSYGMDIKVGFRSK